MQLTDPGIEAELEVDRAEFVDALKLLRKFGKLRGAEAILTYSEDALQIELGGASTSVKAQGSWGGIARVPGVFLSSGLSRSLPVGDPVRIRVHGGRFSVEGLSFGCVWQDIGWGSITLPLDPPLGLLLAVASKYTEVDLENSGLIQVIDNALERRDSLVRRATAILKPLGIQATEIGEFIDTWASTKYKV